jgi:hypothetical protein
MVNTAQMPRDWQKAGIPLLQLMWLTQIQNYLDFCKHATKCQAHTAKFTGGIFLHVATPYTG